MREDRNSPRALRRWARDVIEKSELDAECRKKATEVALTVIDAGGWRGDISDKLKEAGFTNEDFNFALFV